MEYVGGDPFYGDSVGILMLDITAPLIPGNVGNANSYNFPVRFKVLENMPGDWWGDEIGPDESRCEIFVNAAKELEAEGCKAITSGCGFFAIFQKRTAEALKIPVFASPLLMVPMVAKMLGGKDKVGIMTANRERLTAGGFLADVGIDQSVPHVIGGMDKSKEFNDVFVTCDKKSIDPEKMREEVLKVALDLHKKNPDLGAFVLECSDMPPFARAIAQATGLPVFDFISLAHLLHTAIQPVQYPQFFAKTL